MASKTNVIFLGCNYSNKKVKSHFDSLKKDWEAKYPVKVVLIDKERGKGARDIWQEIQRRIKDASLAIFDVSAFRPNVVLELGYALAVKEEEQIVITFDERGSRKSPKKWEMSDIGHLHQVRYKLMAKLNEKLDENLDKVDAIANYKSFCKACEDQTDSPQKYKEAGLLILHALRDTGKLTDAQFQSKLKGTSLRAKTLQKLLKDAELVIRGRGPHGRWDLVDEWA